MTSIDLKQNEEADVNITLGDNESLEKQAEQITDSNNHIEKTNRRISIFVSPIFLELQSSLNGESVDAILNVAGGWAGGHAGDKGMRRISFLIS